MEVKVREENPLATFLKALFGNSEQEKSDIEKEIEYIEKQEDAKHISDLLHSVKAPSVKKSRFNTNNIKAKVSNRNTRANISENNIRVTTERKEQEEKGLDEI